MTTSERMLRLLSLLQTHRYWGGAELADRLSVSERTLRRDIDRLRELGYPVDAARGVAGGYQLRAGAELPPLLLDDDEAVAIAVALQSGAAGQVIGIEETSVQALAKVAALLPPRLRQRIEALTSQTDPARHGSGPRIDAMTLTRIAQCCRDGEGVAFTYVARDGTASERTVEPHRLVSLGRRWYLVAYDATRADWRSFRVDRISAARPTGRRHGPRRLPEGQDAASFVEAGIRTMFRGYDVRVRFACPARSVAGVVRGWGRVEPDGEDACVMAMSADTLDWPMMVLANVDAEFEIERPDELAELVARTGARFARATADAT